LGSLAKAVKFLLLSPYLKAKAKKLKRFQFCLC